MLSTCFVVVYKDVAIGFDVDAMGKPCNYLMMQDVLYLEVIMTNLFSDVS